MPGFSRGVSISLLREEKVDIYPTSNLSGIDTDLWLNVAIRHRPSQEFIPFSRGKVDLVVSGLPLRGGEESNLEYCQVMVLVHYPCPMYPPEHETLRNMYVCIQG